MDGWETSGTVALTDAADTGSQAVQLADQSEVHQTISVQPDTDYIATVRMKVDVEDTFTSTEQYSLDGSTLMGLLVERTSTGNPRQFGRAGRGRHCAAAGTFRHRGLFSGNHRLPHGPESDPGGTVCQHDF